MKILVTGGAGFIGSNFIYYYLEKHPRCEVVCIDALTYAANPYTLEEATNYPGFQFIKGDITDRDFIFDVFAQEDFQMVINFAAESHVDKSIEDPTTFLKTNLFGTQILMDASREFQVQRFHQVSTDEVYGDLPLDRPDLFFTESSVLQASSPYAASKAAADLLAQSYHRTYGLPVTISRCVNNYGPYQFLEKLIPAMIIHALHNEKLPIHGAGINIRDWLHVDDHCAALDLILHHGIPGEVYNIGGKNERNNLEVVKMILNELDKPHDLIEFVKDRPVNDLRYAVDPAKMQACFGWKPVIDFQEGMKRTIRWYQENEDWWKDMRRVLK